MPYNNIVNNIRVSSKGVQCPARWAIALLETRLCLCSLCAHYNCFCYGRNKYSSFSTRTELAKNEVYIVGHKKIKNRSKIRLWTFSNANSAKLSPKVSGLVSRPVDVSVLASVVLEWRVSVSSRNWGSRYWGLGQLCRVHIPGFQYGYSSFVSGGLTRGLATTTTCNHESIVIFRLDALALSVIGTVRQRGWLAGCWLGVRHTPVLYQNG